MSRSHGTIAFAVGMLILSVLACQTSRPPAPTAPVQVVSPAPLAPTQETTAFPTVTPIATSTRIPTPTGSPTSAPTSAAPGGAGGAPTATAQPSGPAARLEFTYEDITYSISPKRKEDGRVQMTVVFHPRGGLAPFSYILDSGPQMPGLTHTFDWHDCDRTEPHTVVIISADGQRSKAEGFMFPYDCE